MHRYAPELAAARVRTATSERVRTQTSRRTGDLIIELAKAFAHVEIGLNPDLLSASVSKRPPIKLPIEPSPVRRPSKLSPAKRWVRDKFTIFAHDVTST
jgi:hypothetical protein